MQPMQIVLQFISSATQNQHETMFCLSLNINVRFNGHFRNLGRPYWI